MGRKAPLEVYGPKGIKAMTKHVLKAWELDIANRVHGMEKEAPSGSRVNAHQIAAGHIYADANIRVRAFPVNHGEMDDAFGFRFENRRQDDRHIRRHGTDANDRRKLHRLRRPDPRSLLTTDLRQSFTKMAGLSPKISYVIERASGACEPSEATIAGALSSGQSWRRQRSPEPGGCWTKSGNCTKALW
jgi:hypothetical protein